jgi:hypothetical protein
MRIARAQHGLENMVYENHARTNLNYNKLIIMREKKRVALRTPGRDLARQGFNPDVVQARVAGRLKKGR